MLEGFECGRVIGDIKLETLLMSGGKRSLTKDMVSEAMTPGIGLPSLTSRDA
jgi:hypothetical protein